MHITKSNNNITNMQLIAFVCFRFLGGISQIVTKMDFLYV